MSRKRSIRQQYINIFIVSLLVAVIGMGSMYIYVKNSLTDLEEGQQESFEKAELIEKMSNSVQDLFFRVRGYYAFQIDDELNGAYQAIQDVHTYSRQYKALTLNSEEQSIVEDIDSFLTDYENTTLPRAIQLVQDNNYEGLRELAKGGANSSINRFIQYANDYNRNVKDSLQVNYEQTKKQTNQFFLLITMLGLTFLLIPIFMVWNVMNRVVRPVETITRVADQYETEGKILFQPIERKDEIGALSQALHKMMQRIQTNEQELLAQNEELVSQQDELYNRQTKMEYALSEARFSKVRLERYNGLGQLLSFSLDEQEICDQTSEYLNTIYQADLSLLWFPQSDTHSIKGMSEQFFEEVKNERMDYLKQRLKTEPYFVIKREAGYEKGIAEQITFVYDFVTCVYNSANEISVIAVLSRIGKPFTEDTQDDLYGLFKRIAIAVDRIEQYELISHERQLNQNILDNINEGIRFVSNGNGEDKYNAALFDLLNMEPETEQNTWPREEWTEYFLQKINEPEQYRAFLEEALDPENHELKQNSYIVSLSTEQSRVMNVYSVPIMINGEKVGTIFVHRDITHEHEVDEMKTELVSTVSHELRTPLSSILGFSELLLNKEMNEERRKRYLETIQSEAHRLTALINDFLDIQRMETGRQTYATEDVSLAELAEQAVNSFSVQSSLHKVQFEDATCTSTVAGDRGRLFQVFNNILANAVKFSPEGGAVKIKIWNHQDTVVVSIADEGIGIPQDDISHLFEKFYRFDNSFSRKIGGTGLGLSICKEIITNHNGQIWINSEEDVGTTVFFSIPLKRQLPNELSSSEKPLVVVVEDNLSIAVLLGEELAANGFSVVHHETVETAFQCILHQQPAAVVVDLVLHDGETGWELIRRMKEQKDTESIPIIISSSVEKDLQLMEEFHIDHYLTKPYPLHELSATVMQNTHRLDGRILYPLSNPSDNA